MVKEEIVMGETYTVNSEFKKESFKKFSESCIGAQYRLIGPVFILCWRAGCE